MAKKWMQRVRRAMQKAGTEGAFTRWCKQRGYSGVTDACINEGLRSDNPTIRKRANLARTFRKVNQ